MKIDSSIIPIPEYHQRDTVEELFDKIYTTIDLIEEQLFKYKNNSDAKLQESFINYTESLFNMPL